MKNIFKDVVGGFISLMVGMGITLKEFFRKPVTVQYPHESLKMAPRYRSHIIFVPDEEGASKCIACNMCVKACPSECIIVEGEKKEGDKKKSVTRYELDFTKCSLCGACVEICPTDAIDFSKRYNLAAPGKEQFQNIDLCKDLEERNRKQ
ncbi:MAG: NuoI/complex I 23 kDa subunit family protein [Opitutales bacterium]